MYLHTIDAPRSKQFFRARLTKVEEGLIRAATEEALESMIDTHFSADRITLDTLKETKTELMQELAAFSNKPNWWSN